MELSGWGRYPISDSEVSHPYSNSEILDIIQNHSGSPLIARGLGRSYGDSSLAPYVINTSSIDYFINFEPDSGQLTCTAGTSLADILDVFVPKGWFLPVTPGTKFVTLGGAIASDVHGKNHHIDGTICEHITSIKIATANQGIIECSPDIHTDLFRATCGGMGLTGIILEATITLKPINSACINQTTIKARNLNEALALFEEHHHATYSVAWIDCLATGSELGRSLIMLGEHAEDGNLLKKNKRKISVPFNLPGMLLNHYSIQAFNALYYNRIRHRESKQSIPYDTFFYPLDSILNWNRLYGKNGFIQYQFVIPKEAGIEGMTLILQRIAKSKRGSFLAVLKAFGKQNNNFLSFPIEGYTLALDFKFDKSLLPLLNELDKIVADSGGRIYLSKDSRMSEDTFKQTYPQWESFKDVRIKYGANEVFNSLQSQRLGL